MPAASYLFNKAQLLFIFVCHLRSFHCFCPSFLASVSPQRTFCNHFKRSVLLKYQNWTKISQEKKTTADIPYKYRYIIFSKVIAK